MTDVYRGAIGSKLRWTVEDNCEILDVSGATLKEVKLVRPDGSSVVKPLSYVTDGKDGLVQYIVESGVLTKAGTYKWQLHFQLSTWQDHSCKGTFTVGEPLF